MTQDLQQYWQRCCTFLRDNLGESRFNRWFGKTRAIKLENDELTLQVPSNYFVELYESTYYNILEAALKFTFGKEIRLYYMVQVVAGDDQSQITLGESRQSPVISSKLERSTTNDVLPGTPQQGVRGSKNINSQLNARYNFETYCTGHSNILAVTIAQNIAENPRNNNFNPFFLYGNVGIGKTHLIQAIGIRIKEKNPNAKVLYTTARQFQHLYAQAAQKKTVPQFINWFMQLDVLLLDDLQEIAGMVKTSEALFPIFNHLHQNGKQLIFTCDRPPMELDGMADRLIDRFKWGLTERLPGPDAELRKKILAIKASLNGLDFPEEVMDYIANNAVHSVREIEGVVMGILNRSITLNAPITLDLAREVMRNTIKLIEKKPINFEMIVEATADYYNINPDALFSKTRMRDINDARQVLMYLSHKHTGLSSTVIGRKLNRGHGTVLHGIAAVKDRLPIVPELSKAIEAIEAKL